MPPGQAAELLTAIIGQARAQGEPEAVGEIARLCGYLPLALRIAGARLVSRPTWKVSWFATRLAHESKRLDLLKAGDLEIRASFGLSYLGRAETEHRAFRMLGLLAPDFPAWNLAAVLETDTDDAEELGTRTPRPPGSCAAWAPCTGSSAATTKPSPCSRGPRRSSRSHADRRRRAAVLRNLGDTYRYQGRLGQALIETFSAAGGPCSVRLAIARSQAGALNGMADAHRRAVPVAARQHPQAPWLFNSFIKSNAADVCARLGLPLPQYRSAMLACGVSLEPDARADQPGQARALLRFVGTPEAAGAVEARIDAMRHLVLDYATQHHLAEAGTGLVDIGWTGRMAGSLIDVCEAAGMSRPYVLFWGPSRVRRPGGQIPNGWGLSCTTRRPRRGWDGGSPTLRSSWKPSVWATMASSLAIAWCGRTDRARAPVARNDAVKAWGLRLYRSTAVRLLRRARG